MFGKRKEMEAVSRALEKLLNGEEPETEGLNSDSLPSKVRHQILRLSDKMRGHEEKLRKEKEDIKQLIAETAHQLRTPLANMEGYLELLSDENCTREEQREYLKAMEASEARIRFLTNGFIKMARLESRIIQIRKSDQRLYDTVLNSILQVQTEADAKKIKFSLCMDENLKLLHDANWLGEAVGNLLDNSVKYSPVGSEIEIQTVKNEMYTQIAVRDSGSGIDEGEENLIFQRFYRGKRVKNESGFGLGLYLAREIVMQHGGFMKAKPLKKGLEISIYLPE